jgi:hypothetical protein
LRRLSFSVSKKSAFQSHVGTRNRRRFCVHGCIALLLTL